MVPSWLQDQYRAHHPAHRPTPEGKLQTHREEGFGKLPKDVALEIIDLIRSTYLYEDDESLPYLWNEQDMKGAIEYASSQSGEDYIYCLYRKDRNIARYRENGNFNRCS